MPFPARILTVNGESLPLTEWATRYRLAPETIRVRLDRLGWDETRAVITPADKRFKRGGRPRLDTPRAVPRMTWHKSSGRARVAWRAGGRRFCRYLGSWGTAGAKLAYRQFCAEWAAGAFDAPTATAGAGRLTVGALVVRRLVYADREYRKGGKPTTECAAQRSAFGPLNDLYGKTPADEFGPVRLEAVRAAMIEKGWARTTININVSRIVAAFKWAASKGWVPAAVPAALRELAGLKAGKTAAPERKRKRPVPDADLAAVLPHLSPIPARCARLAAAIRFQRLIGCRPIEVCALRPADLDRTGDVWLYVVPDESNKNLHRDKVQRYWIGPRGQAELRPYLDGPADRPVFRTNRGSYSLAVRLACKAVNAERAATGAAPMPFWTPHQLRHSLATEVAREIGTMRAAADAIGDTPETAARHYVHVDPTERARIEWARDRG